MVPAMESKLLGRTLCATVALTLGLTARGARARRARVVLA